ncbi:Ulp1 protease family [Forsythia ovata]|uniref:Ulp1 protease family n=1 Tax=Forsythia ovata TaxID=205694 RepID=A0ABD1PYF0_9LAMI
MKKKINIPVEQGEKEEPMVIHLNDDSKIESHPSAAVLQSSAQHDDNSAGQVRASNFGQPGKEQQSAAHEQQSNDYSEPSVIKLDDRNNTSLSIVDPVDQDADKSTTKRMKICSNESFSGLNTFEDDLVFSEEDLITIDKSAEQHRLDGGEIDVQTRAHWILGHFDIANWYLDVYNSAYKTIRDVVVMDAIQPLLNIIPHLLRQSNVLKFEAPDLPLSSRLCKGTLQQTNGGDYGIFITKYAEYIHQKKISTMPNPLDTKLARHNMAVQLYKYATEKPDIQGSEATNETMPKTMERSLVEEMMEHSRHKQVVIMMLAIGFFDICTNVKCSCI